MDDCKPLNLGMFAHPECPGACGGNYVGELASRAWLAGRRLHSLTFEFNLSNSRTRS